MSDSLREHFFVKRLEFYILGVLALAACAGLGTPTPIGTTTLWPMPSPTALPNTAFATPIIIASPIPPTPLPTPVTYRVQEGDTLVYVAWLFQLSVEELQAANPGVDARFLTVGTLLSIPDPEGDPVATTAPPTLTPAPINITLSVPICYPTPTNNLYCFVEAHNADTTLLENISAQVVLADANGLPLMDATAYSAVNVLPVGAAAPLMAVFTAPSSSIAATGARLLTAQRVADNAALRYHPIEIVSSAGQASAEGWRVTGQLHNSTPLTLTQVWVTAVLYDAQGSVVGYRTEPLAGLASDETRAISISAVSLGHAVHHSTLLAEGRP